MSSKTVANDNIPSTETSLNDLSIILNGNVGIATMVASSDKTLKNVTEVEQKSKNCFTSLLSFCILFGTGSMFSYSINTYLSSQITTIEKVFGLSSSKSALLLSANDIGFVTTVLFAAHFLHRYHIPRILAVCVFTVGVSGIVLALPKLFLSDAPVEDQSLIFNTSRSSEANLCVQYNGSESAKLNGSSCKPDLKEDAAARRGHDSNILLLVAMGIALVIQGIATSPRQALQTIHVDNNTERSNTGFYVGVLTTFTIFGPFLALIVGALFNKIPTHLRATSLSPTDPRWVGAWWMGFLVFGGCCITSSIPLFWFPRGRGSNYKRKGNDPKENQNQSGCQNLKELPKSALRVFKEPVYTLSCLNNISTLFAVMALGSFGPKYLETQFFLPTWKANIILGADKLAATSLGTMIGGYITRRMRLTRTGCLKLIFFARLTCAILAAFNYLFGCDHPHLFRYDSKSGENRSVLFSCDCDDTSYLPVCVDGSKTYFSPCHAGCEEKENWGYTKCSLSSSGQATSGICNDSCDFLIPFIIVNALGSLIGTISIAPNVVVFLRSVKDEDRSLAVGLSSFLLAILVFLPAPLVYGKIFDSVCLIWQTTCGKQGACSLYDSLAMRTRLISMDFGLKLIALILTALALLLSARKGRIEDMKEMDVPKPTDVEMPKGSRNNTHRQIQG